MPLNFIGKMKATKKTSHPQGEIEPHEVLGDATLLWTNYEKIKTAVALLVYAGVEPISINKKNVVMAEQQITSKEYSGAVIPPSQHTKHVTVAEINFTLDPSCANYLHSLLAATIKGQNW